MRRRFFQTHKNNVENLTLVSLEDNNEIYLNVRTFDITGEIEMKVSGDYKWMPNGAVILNKGDFVEYRGTISNIVAGQDRIGTFVISKKVNLYGDCTSILKDRMLFNDSLAYLFENTPVVNIHSTFLPATKLASSCYYAMFRGCTKLTAAPELPAMTLASSCYQDMFKGCTSLTTAPALPATTLAEFCYFGMFSGCTSLTTAPELPATTLASSCYYQMFSDCTKLTAAPELPATTLVNYCYLYMFYGCRNLNYIKMLATDISANSCLFNWVSGISSTGTFVKNPAMTTLPTGTSGIPSRWTVVNDGGDLYLTLNTTNADNIKAYQIMETQKVLAPNRIDYDWIPSTTTIYVSGEAGRATFTNVPIDSACKYSGLDFWDVFFENRDAIGPVNVCNLHSDGLLEAYDDD